MGRSDAADGTGGRPDPLGRKISGRREQGLYRTLEELDSGLSRTGLKREGERLLNFCSNDYLGLAGHPEVIGRSIRYLKEYGAGSSASRLVSGSLSIHHRLEEKIAAMYGRQACLLFGNGFLANSTLLPAIAGRDDLILADRHVHKSIIQGAAASRARLVRFRHNDTEHLEELLGDWNSDARKGTCWVVTETLFSMDGDFAPIERIGELCDRYGARFMADDAHAFGLYGNSGLGLGEGQDRIDLLLATFGKAGGGYGAFVVCSKELKDYLVNFCSGVIYTTSLPPSVVGAADAALDLVPGMGEERRVLLQRAQRLISTLNEAGLDTGSSRSQIIPILAEDEKSVLLQQAALADRKIHLQAIRPPTVRRSRLRLTLSAAHTPEELDRLTKALIEVAGEQP